MNARDRFSLAAVAALVTAGLIDESTLDDEAVGALLHLSLTEHDQALHAVICREYEIRSLLCADCPSFVIGPGKAVTRRWWVVHEATCPVWLRYQMNLGGYTALPSGTVISAGDPPPEGTTRLVANRPGSPCGAVVTHRGPLQQPGGPGPREGGPVVMNGFAARADAGAGDPGQAAMAEFRNAKSSCSCRPATATIARGSRNRPSGGHRREAG
jgi:hypothetical protein